MVPLEEMCCQNSECEKYGVRGAGNLSVCGQTGKKQPIRQLYCNVCGARLSERKGTPLYNAKKPPQAVIAIAEHLREGCGVRQTARLLGVSKNTVTRYVRLFGRHAEAFHDEYVAFSPSDL